MKKLKVLIINDYAYAEGGAGRVAIDSAAGLSREKHDVVFLSAVGPESEELKNANLSKIICLGQKDILSNKNILESFIKGIHNYNAVAEIKKLFKYWIPDIVHVHGVSKAISWVPIKTINRYGIPIVYTIHDFGLICPNMGIYNFNKSQLCEYYKKGYSFKCFITNCDKRNYFQKLWRWIRFLYNNKIMKIMSKINGFIAVSYFIYDFFKDILPERSLFSTIPNPVEFCDNLENCINPSNDGKIVFLYVGRLSKEKGIDILIEAFKDLDARLVIIGDGELMPLVRNSEGDKRITIMGWQDKETIYEKMKTSNVLVQPSIVLETSGIAIMEAAKFCVPSIVGKYGGQTDFVKEDVNGLFFKAGDIGSLRYAMKRFIDDKKLAKKLGKGARNMLKNRGTGINEYTFNLVNYYGEVINNNSN